MKMGMRLIALVLLMAMLAVDVSAAVTPSVENKGAPSIEENTIVVDGQEKSVAIIVYDDEGEIADGIEVPNIQVTPYADKETAGETVQQEMGAAYASIADAESLEEAAPVLEKVVEKLLELAEEAGVASQEELKVENLVVRDLFHVSLDEEAQRQAANGETVGLTFDLGISEDEVVIVMRYAARKDIPEGVEVPEGDGLLTRVLKVFTEDAPVAEAGEEAPGLWDRLWDAITGKSLENEKVWFAEDPENVTVNQDGTVSVRVTLINNDVGTVAFVTERVED